MELPWYAFHNVMCAFLSLASTSFTCRGYALNFPKLSKAHTPPSMHDRKQHDSLQRHRRPGGKAPST